MKIAFIYVQGVQEVASKKAPLLVYLSYIIMAEEIRVEGRFLFSFLNISNLLCARRLLMIWNNKASLLSPQECQGKFYRTASSISVIDKDVLKTGMVRNFWVT